MIQKRGEVFFFAFSLSFYPTYRLKEYLCAGLLDILTIAQNKNH